jgi:Skp family chaperone for outer membrane proteins
MNINRKAIGVIAVLTFCLLCSVIAYQASASRNMAGRPTAVAVVNLQVLVDGLNQYSDAIMRIERMRSDREAEGDRRAALMKTLQDELKDIPEASTEAKRAKEDQIMLEQLNNQAWLRLSADKLDIEKSLSLQDLYRSIKQAIGALAAADGWDIVLVDDSRGELGINPNSQLSREAQITQQMVSRRVLFAAGAVDITDQLITRMNNAYQSGGTAGY